MLMAIAVCALLALTGFVGGGRHDERFDAKQITIVPSGADGVRIREVVDRDFGDEDRHGYERIIPDDFGEPTEITASSPDADASVSVAGTLVLSGSATRIRLGDPDRTYSGQHRYVLAYTLPSALISTRRLALDIIDSGEDFETDRFEVVVSGMTLADTRCNVGTRDAVGGCTLTAEPDGTYRVVFSPLHAGDGITIGGTITAVAEGALPPVPAPPRYRSNDRGRLALILVLVGLAAAGVVFTVAKRRGRNEVFSGGAAEAAFGQLPSPGGLGLPVAPPPTMLVSDAKMDEMATTEFAPPRGLDPWQGSVLLNERIDDTTVGAWFSALAAREAITLTQRDDKLVIGVGRRRSELDPSNSALVDQFLHGRDELTLGSYDEHFAGAWAAIKAQQGAAIQASGWWKRRAPKPGLTAASGPVAAIVILVVILFFLGGSVVSAIVGVFRTLPLAVVFGAIVPGFMAYCCYATLLPVRSATGSALALLTESFRRFLAASEGQHVEWAWKQGLLREYSAWAVSLGAADAWEKALTHSNVPPSEYVSANPLLISSLAHSFATSHTVPSSSGSSGGGGGGFSGGSVGGGGGGGSSGSW